MIRQAILSIQAAIINLKQATHTFELMDMRLHKNYYEEVSETLERSIVKLKEEQARLEANVR